MDRQLITTTAWSLFTLLLQMRKPKGGEVTDCRGQAASDGRSWFQTQIDWFASSPLPECSPPPFAPDRGKKLCVLSQVNH